MQNRPVDTSTPWSGPTCTAPPRGKFSDVATRGLPQASGLRAGPGAGAREEAPAPEGGGGGTGMEWYPERTRELFRDVGARCGREPEWAASQCLTLAGMVCSSADEAAHLEWLHSLPPASVAGGAAGLASSMRQVALLRSTFPPFVAIDKIITAAPHLLAGPAPPGRASEQPAGLETLDAAAMAPRLEELAKLLPLAGTLGLPRLEELVGLEPALLDTAKVQVTLEGLEQLLPATSDPVRVLCSDPSVVSGGLQRRAAGTGEAQAMSLSSPGPSSNKPKNPSPLSARSLPSPLPATSRESMQLGVGDDKNNVATERERKVRRLSTLFWDIAKQNASSLYNRLLGRTRPRR